MVVIKILNTGEDNPISPSTILKTIRGIIITLFNQTINTVTIRDNMLTIDPRGIQTSIKIIGDSLHRTRITGAQMIPTWVGNKARYRIISDLSNIRVLTNLVANKSRAQQYPKPKTTLS